jgi:predicted Zn-dependent protease
MSEVAVLNEDQAKTLLSRVLKLSPAHATEVSIESQDTALTRFANNNIIQNVAENDLKIAIRVLHQDKMGRAVTNKTDADSLAASCEQALHLAKHTSPDPQTLPLPGRQSYEKTSSFFDSTYLFNAQQRAEQVERMVRLIRNDNGNLPGAPKTGGSAIAIGNSQGLFAFSKSTSATVSVTANIDNCTGMSVMNEPDIEKIDGLSLAKTAIDKAVSSKETVEVPAGEYTVILEPLAVLNLLSSLLIDYISQVSHFSGIAVKEKLGFVADRIGQKVFGEKFTLDDDAYHPLHQGVPFDGEGMPRMPVILIYNGILAHVVHTRASALQIGEEPTGHALEQPNPYGAVPQHLVMRGRAASIDDMVKKTAQGLYITRFWYNRLVDPGRLTVTGTTRDGTFLIRNGEITGAIKNLRFNVSLFNVFNNITDLGKEVRTYDEESGRIMVIPPIRVEGFRFTGGE